MMNAAHPARSGLEGLFRGKEAVLWVLQTVIQRGREIKVEQSLRYYNVEKGSCIVSSLVLKSVVLSLICDFCHEAFKN